MLVDVPLFWEQVRLGEDSGLELKEARFQDERVSAPHRDGLADGFAAFANTGGGRVVLGVADDRTPQSLTSAQLDLLANLVTEICSDSIDPPLDFSIFRVPAPPPTSGGVLLVDIPAGATVHRSPGGSFRRRGDSKRQMQPDDIRRLLQSRGQSDATATDSQVVRNTGANSLSPELWRRYASSRTNDPAEITLTKLKFVKDDRHGAMRATVGGILLAADDPREWLPNAHIQAVRYDGTRLDGNRQVDAQHIGGPLDQQIRDAVRFVLASRLGQCPVGDVPGAGGRAYFIQRRGEGVGVIEDETFSLAGEKPVFELIGERELKLVLPAASPPLPEGVATRVSVRHLDTGEPLQGIHVVLIYPNKTCREERTDAFGHADFELHARLPMTVLCAAPGLTAWVARDHELDGPLDVRMSPAPNGGSLIIANRSGHLPGIQGRLSPILDNLDRTYLYADNIAINDGLLQPVHFNLNEPVRLTDSLGAGATLWFREMLGSSCIFDYRYDR